VEILIGVLATLGVLLVVGAAGALVFWRLRMRRVAPSTSEHELPQSEKPTPAAEGTSYIDLPAKKSPPQSSIEGWVIPYSELKIGAELGVGS
jgi:hypothetical protein